MKLISRVLCFIVFLELSYVACSTVTTISECNPAPTDIVFLLDSSTSVGTANLKKLLDFVVVLSKTFDIGPNIVQIGVVTFSTSPRLEFNLSTYHVKDQLETAIRNISYKSGVTSTGLALNFVKDVSFSKSAGDRDNIPNILIVMTDGKSGSRHNTELAAKALHLKKIKVLVVGIGTSLDTSELKVIATDVRNVIIANQFNVLNTTSERLRQMICTAVGGWTNFSPCSKSCDGGYQHRTRYCSNPPTSGSTRNCSGQAIDTRPCNTQPCSTAMTSSVLPFTSVRTVDGGWTEYGNFSTCSKSCGGGMQIRLRACNNPIPSHGGRPCAGQTTERKTCNVQPCTTATQSTTTTTYPPTTTAISVDGGWTNFSKFSICSKTCGGGLQSRQRACINPPPSNGGANCYGEAVDIVACNVQSCHLKTSTKRSTTVRTSSTTLPTAPSTLSTESAVDPGQSASNRDDFNHDVNVIRNLNDRTHLLICIIIGTLLIGITLLLIYLHVCKGEKKKRKTNVRNLDF